MMPSSNLLYITEHWFKETVHFKTNIYRGRHYYVIVKPSDVHSMKLSKNFFVTRV